VVQEKEEPSNGYKMNQQEALDEWIMQGFPSTAAQWRRISTLTLPSRWQRHTVSCRARAYLLQSACAKNALFPATCSSRTLLDSIVNSVRVGSARFPTILRSKTL
jgi:hypothetical protein